MFKLIIICLFSLYLLTIDALLCGKENTNFLLSTQLKLIGVISSSRPKDKSVVVLKDINTGKTYIKKNGDTLIINEQTFTITQILSKKIILYANNKFFILHKEGFINNPNTDVALHQTIPHNNSQNFNNELISKEDISFKNFNNYNASINSNNISEPQNNPNNDFTDTTDAESQGFSTYAFDKYPINAETIQLLEEFYKNPHAFSEEQIKQLEEKLFLSSQP